MFILKPISCDERYAGLRRSQRPFYEMAGSSIRAVVISSTKSQPLNLLLAASLDKLVWTCQDR